MVMLGRQSEIYNLSPDFRVLNEALGLHRGRIGTRSWGTNGMYNYAVLIKLCSG